MIAICKREIRSYFSSPVGYVCIAALAALYGFYYFQVMYIGMSSYISAVYSTMFSFGMMIIPIITMKSMSDDQKNKTDQALLTAPVGVTSIVMGKFLACFFVFFVASTLGLLPACGHELLLQPPLGEIIGNYIGTLLYGGAMISIGVFISSLTVSQIIAAIGNLYCLHSAHVYRHGGLYREQHGGQHHRGVDFLYQPLHHIRPGPVQHFQHRIFPERAAVFVFLTARRLESRRWS